MLLCDEEPSPVSSDEVFFICEKQEGDDEDEDDDDDEDEDDDNDDDDHRDNEMESGSETKSDDSKCKRIPSKRFDRKIVKKKSSERVDLAERNTETETSGKRSKEPPSQTSQTIVVKIQVENCSPCPEKSIALFSRENTPSTNKENARELKKKTVAVQMNFNSIDSCVEARRVKGGKLRCCGKASSWQSSARTKRSEAASEKTCVNIVPGDSTKIYLWNGGKSAKKKQQAPLLKSNSVVEKPTTRATSNNNVGIREPLQKSNSLVEKTSIKCKKPLIGCSPLKKLNRSSLTIEPDKITINLSKYSPCASRLAASSKILSSNSPLSPESPLQGVRSKSPRRQDFQRSEASVDDRPMEKSTLQASLSLNIQQCQKTQGAPRSRSVGDSCVTSPTSEATTLSYSPTGTEILSLEEVAPQITLNDLDIDDSTMVLRKREARDKFTDDYIACSRKVNLETKC